jgi:hypothetical protein
MTDLELLDAARAIAGGWVRLSEVPTMPSWPTLWRWRKAGRISNRRQRAILEQYVRSAHASEAP